MLLVAQTGGVGVFGSDAVHGVVHLWSCPTVHLEGRRYPFKRVPLHSAATVSVDINTVIQWTEATPLLTHTHVCHLYMDSVSRATRPVPFLLQGSEVFLEGRADLAQQLYQRMAQETGISWFGVEGVGSRSGIGKEGRGVVP